MRNESKVLENPQEEFDYFYKFVIIGDEGVGKTNFMRRITGKSFDLKPKITYGVEFSIKTVPLPNSNQRVRAQLWDTSGAKQFLSITTTHYRFAVGAFLIYDVTSKQSFNNVKEHWLRKVREFSDDNVCVALVGNKGDLVDAAETVHTFSKVIMDTEEKEAEEFLEKTKSRNVSRN